MPSCFSCGAQIQAQTQMGERIGRSETCPKCRVDLHCCRNCDFYDPKAYNECREPQAERVLEKDRSNFCDYFQATGAQKGIAKAADDARKKLEALFKKGTS